MGTGADFVILGLVFSKSKVIMGSYDGKMTFYEPMITLDYLITKPNITKPAPVPTKFSKAGYYPMKYSIKQVGDNIEISLDEMMLMQ